jgi:hypothetical protein
VAVAAVAVACERTGGTVTGVALAGPTCPVVREPPDPACDDRPVSGAEIVVLDARGDEVERARTDDAGAFLVELPAGEYQLVPQPVEGLLGTPAALAIVVGDQEDSGPLTIQYDTGIR